MGYINTVHEFLECLRQGSYSSVGCYPLFFLTSDGETLSPKSARENVWQIARAIRDRGHCGWRVVGHDVNWEDPEMYCADSGARIESAYAEDQAEILRLLWASHRDGEPFDGSLESARARLTAVGFSADEDDLRMLQDNGRLEGWG